MNYEPNQEAPFTMTLAGHGSYLCSDENVGHVGHAGLELWHPLLLYVVVGGRVNHRETDKEDVCVWVGERSQLIVVLLQMNRQHQDEFITLNQPSILA